MCRSWRSGSGRARQTCMTSCTRTPLPSPTRSSRSGASVMRRLSRSACCSCICCAVPCCALLCCAVLCCGLVDGKHMRLFHCTQRTCLTSVKHKEVMSRSIYCTHVVAPFHCLQHNHFGTFWGFRVLSAKSNKPCRSAHSIQPL